MNARLTLASLAITVLGCASTPAEPPSTADDGKAPSGEHAAHEHGMHDHQSNDADHEHQGHGKPGLHLDFSDVERYAKRFDGPDRDAWQKPTEAWTAF